MRRIPLADGEYYHIYNRGVEKRTIFGSRADYERFLFDLYALNDRRPFLNSQYHYRGSTSIERLATRTRTGGVGQQRIALVDLVCFCLMPNHYHLLLRQRGDDGVSLFMQKIGTAYTMYFNEKYQRSGVLFQGKYKAIHVPRDRYFLPLSRYIHLNPLDMIEPRWKRMGIKSIPRARRFLLTYPWSSYADYVGNPQFPLLLNTELIRGIVGGPARYRSYVEAHHLGDWKDVSPPSIEVEPL